VTGYTVLHRAGPNAPTNSTTLPDNATSYTATGLTDGTAYRFAVEAVNRSGAGPATAWASATPSLSSPPLAPAELTPAPAVTAVPGPGQVSLKEARPRRPLRPR
jgi:hypothetical protein